MSALSETPAFQKYNPFRRPDWRWERVLSMIDRPVPRRATRRDDEWVRKARSFALRWRARTPDEREPMFHEDPGLYYAYLMFLKQIDQEDSSLYVRARLLAGMSHRQIAEAAGTLPQAIGWYERLFFDVGESLQARDWVVSMVLVPAMMRNFRPETAAGQDQSPWQQQVVAKPFADASLQMFAYFGGPVLCEFMISGFQQGRKCQSADQISEWLDGHWSANIRARSAQAARAFQIDKWNVTELFAVHAQIMQIEKSSDSLNMKQSAIEQHIASLISGLRAVWHVPPTDPDGAAPHAAELRDDELLRGDDRGQDILETLRLPPPRS